MLDKKKQVKKSSQVKLVMPSIKSQVHMLLYFIKIFNFDLQNLAK
jgi:hypothetical protein